MSNRWLTAFKEIHGHEPTKQDYELAPRHIRDELLGGCEEEKEEALIQKPSRKSAVRLKRPADDQYSPFKPLPKRQAIDLAVTPTTNRKKSRALFSPCRKAEEQSPTRATPLSRCTPQKSPVRFSSNLFDTPVKGCSSPLPAEKFVIVPEDPLSIVESSMGIGQETNRRTSPRKPISSNLSCFATPSKEQRSTSSAEEAIFNVLRTPIRSPPKPCRKVLHITNVDALLAPTPEKKPNREEEQPIFEAENVPEEISKKTSKRRLAGGVAKVFDPTTGRIISRAFKRADQVGSAEEKSEKKTAQPKEKGNFVRINLRKKNFTRGKVSAEAKRKLRRKQIWKKRFGNR